MKIFLALLFLLPVVALPQTAAVDLPLTVSDDAGSSINMRFGLDPTATDSIDLHLGEFELPPIPPTGLLDARFQILNNIAVWRDYRTGNASFSGTKYHKVKFYPGHTATYTKISWSLPPQITGRLQDAILGTVINVPMKDTGSLIIPVSTPIYMLKMTVDYNLSNLPPSPPVLFYPPNNAVNIPEHPAFKWQRVTGADTYTLQVSKNPWFTQIVVSDSLITDTVRQVDGLLPNTEYFWRVQGRNRYGTGAFSAAGSFTTQPLSSVISIKLPLTVSDNRGASNVLYYGLAADATDGLDAHLGEYPLPPFPPSGSFEARFLINQLEASYKDFRQGTTAFTGTKVHTIQYQTGGSAITVAWNLPPYIAGRLQDVILGTIIDVAMNGSGSFTVTNPLGINKLKITVTYSGSVPVPAPPVLRYPAHNASVLNSFQCSWQPVFGADEYILQLARDVNFTTLTLNESIVDTVKFFPYLATWGDNYWRVQAVNASGGSVYSETRRFTYMSTGIPQERAGNADGYFLGQNYPNPFNPFTTIEYRLAGEQFVELSLYDVLGRKVATLVNKAQAQGQYTIRFDASRLPSGTYFYELRVNGSRAIRKMQLNK